MLIRHVVLSLISVSARDLAVLTGMIATECRNKNMKSGKCSQRLFLCAFFESKEIALQNPISCIKNLPRLKVFVGF
jgi:hypothetical protein